MSVWRWLATIVGYPLGGLLAIQFFSTTDGPAAAAAGGLVAGAVLGLVQWLALRPRVTAVWIAVTAGSLALGAAAGAALTGGATTVSALVGYGAVAGAALGLAQGIALRMTWWRIATWTATVSGTWAIAWLISAAVIVDEARGFITFGLSGAAVVTVVGALVLRGLLGARPARRVADAVAPTGATS